MRQLEADLVSDTTTSSVSLPLCLPPSLPLSFLLPSPPSRILHHLSQINSNLTLLHCLQTSPSLYNHTERVTEIIENSDAFFSAFQFFWTVSQTFRSSEVYQKSITSYTRIYTMWYTIRTNTAGKNSFHFYNMYSIS